MRLFPAFLLHCCIWFCHLQSLHAQPACVSTNCCCGTPFEIGIPNGNFETPQTGQAIVTYSAGNVFGGWSVVTGEVDLLGPNYINWATGNPNGASQFLDLHGTVPGTIATTLTGLTPGYTYTIVIWYAKNAGTPSASCNITVAGGAWLNETWTATNNGATGWLEICFDFVAQAPTTVVQLAGSSPFPAGGMLLDDMSMWGCPTDSQGPTVDNPPAPTLLLACDEPLPATSVSATDNCTPTVTTNFAEVIVPSPCLYTVERTWTFTDGCGNQTIVEQAIEVTDTEPPFLNIPPADLTVSCDANTLNAFNAWLANNGGAVATDNCSSSLNWQTAFAVPPNGSCGQTLVTFSVTDDCGNEALANAYFTVNDNDPPTLLLPAQDLALPCNVDVVSIFSNWLSTNGFAEAADPCGPVTWANDHSGGIPFEPVTVSFSAFDLCGNITTTTGVFSAATPPEPTYLQTNTCVPAMAGVFTQSLAGQNGCDSTVVTEVLLLPGGDTTFLQTSTCVPAMAGVFTQSLAGQNGCDSIVVTQILWSPPPTADLLVSDFGGYGVSCHNAENGFIEAEADGVAPLVFLWSNGSTEPTQLGLPPGGYAITITDGNGCTSNFNTILLAPQPLETALEIGAIRCFEENSGSISVEATGGVAPYQYALNGGAGQGSGLFGNVGAGTYTLEITDANGCLASEAIWINAPLSVSVDLGEDQYLQLGDSTTISAIVNLPFSLLDSVTWSPGSAFECPSCPSQPIAPVVTTAYSVRVLAENGCSAEDQLTVYVDRRGRVFLPSAFSPNEDGLNDLFYPFAKPNSVKNFRSFLVFSRWGETVFEQYDLLPNAPNRGWDGKHRGELLDPGVFVWLAVVEFADGSTDVLKGEVNLVR